MGSHPLTTGVQQPHQAGLQSAPDGQAKSLCNDSVPGTRGADGGLDAAVAGGGVERLPGIGSHRSVHSAEGSARGQPSVGQSVGGSVGQGVAGGGVEVGAGAQGGALGVGTGARVGQGPCSEAGLGVREGPWPLLDGQGSSAVQGGGAQAGGVQGGGLQGGRAQAGGVQGGLAWPRDAHCADGACGSGGSAAGAGAGVDEAAHVPVSDMGYDPGAEQQGAKRASSFGSGSGKEEDKAVGQGGRQGPRDAGVAEEYEARPGDCGRQGGAGAGQWGEGRQVVEDGPGARLGQDEGGVEAEEEGGGGGPSGEGEQRALEERRRRARQEEEVAARVRARLEDHRTVEVRGWVRGVWRRRGEG